MIRVLYELLSEGGGAGFTLRDVAARARVGVSTAARVVGRLERLGVLTLAGGGWVARPKGQPGFAEPFRYATHWPPRRPTPADL